MYKSNIGPLIFCFKFVKLPFENISDSVFKVFLHFFSNFYCEKSYLQPRKLVNRKISMFICVYVSV